MSSLLAGLRRNFDNALTLRGACGLCRQTARSCAAHLEVKRQRQPVRGQTKPSTSWTGLHHRCRRAHSIVEMRLQRVFGYRPNSAFSLPSFDWRPHRGSPAWSCVPKRVDDHKDGARPAAVDCINVGVGVARNVEATWEFDRELAVEELSPLLANSGYSIWASEEGLSRVDLEEGPDSRVTIMGDLSAATRAPYLLPAQSPENVIHIPLPPDYLLLLGLHLQCGGPVDSIQLMSLRRLPPLFLHLSFIDTGGATRKNRIELRFRLTYLASTTGPGGAATPPVPKQQLLLPQLGNLALEAPVICRLTLRR